LNKGKELTVFFVAYLPSLEDVGGSDLRQSLALGARSVLLNNIGVIEWCTGRKHRGDVVKATTVVLPISIVVVEDVEGVVGVVVVEGSSNVVVVLILPSESTQLSHRLW
jgi:hypothetical protein